MEEKTAENGLGGYLRELRRGQRLSHARLAHAAGVAKSTLIRWETGAHLPRRYELEAALHALRASPEQCERACAFLDAPRAREGFSETPGSFPTLGDLLRAMRQRRGLRLEQVAGTIGVSPSTVSRWEGGKFVLPPELREPLLDSLQARPCERAVFEENRLLLGPASEPPRSLDEIGAELADLFQKLQFGNHALMDLEFLILRTRLCPLMGRSEGARELLAQAHFTYALGLSWVDRRGEAARSSEQALELMGTSPEMRESRINTVIISALMTAKSGSRNGPDRAVEQLRSVLPLAAKPILATGIYRDMADYAGRDGRTEAALEWIRLAYETADRAEDESAGRLAQYVHAQILLEAGQARMSLPLLQESILSPVQRVLEAMQGARALLELGDTSGAHDWVTKASDLLDRYDYPHLRPPLNDLARRL